MADFISTYHGSEFEEGLRRIIINDPESLAWVDKGTMTNTEFNSFNELGNWKIRINPYSDNHPYPYDYNVIIFEKPVDGISKRYRITFMTRANNTLLYDWNGTTWVANMSTGMAGPITLIGISPTVPTPGSFGNYNYVLVKANDASTVMLYGKGSDGKTWLPVMNEDVMYSSIYDPSNRKKPPLKYLDDVYIIPDTTTPIMLKTHIPDKVIHMTPTERNQWVAAITQAQLNQFITEMKDLAKTQHESVVQNAGMDTTDTNITMANNNLNYHIQDKKPDGSGPRTEKIHISQKDRDYFNSKAPGDHRHDAAAHKVQISAAKVVSGVFSVDRMPPETLLKIRIVPSRDAMLHFSPASSVHIGDVFHVVPTTGNEEWYRVKDLTKLTMLDGYYDFTVKPEAITGDWNKITDKPTTVAELGATDLYTKTEVDKNSAEGSVEGIEKAYYDPERPFMANQKTIGDATWLMHNYRYPQGYQGNGDNHPGNFSNTNAARVPSLYRIINRLHEMRYMKSRNTENYINQFTFGSTIWGQNKNGKVSQQLNPYQMYYPFVSQIKLRNPIFQMDSIYGHGVVIGFERRSHALWYTKVNDGVMHYLDLYALRYSAPTNQRDLDAEAVNMNSLIKSTVPNSAFSSGGYVMNIAVIPAIASYDKSKTPYTFSAMDNGGIAVVFRTYTWLIPFNDSGILDVSGALTILHSLVFGDDRDLQGIIPQKRLDIEPFYADRYSDRTKYADHTSRYPIGFIIRYVLYTTKVGTPTQNGLYVHAARISTRPTAEQTANRDSHYEFESTDLKSSLDLTFNVDTSATINSATTWAEVLSSSIHAMVYGGGSGPRDAGDWDANSSPYCGKLAIGSKISDTPTASRFLHKWNIDNHMQVGSYVTVSKNDGGRIPSFYNLPDTVALYDTRTVFRLDENKVKIAMYGKALMKCDWDTSKTHQSMELLMVQNVVHQTHPKTKNATGGTSLTTNDIKRYNREENQLYIVPISQLINDFKCRKKNVAVSIPTPNYRVTIDRTSDTNPAFTVEAGKVLSWHTLDASLSDIYYFDYVAGRYLMIVGTEYRSLYDGIYTLIGFERRNSADTPLRESEIVFLESYDDCKSFQVVKVMPKFRPEDLLAARNEYPKSIADTNPILTPGHYLLDMNTWNLGANAKLAIVVQDEVAYIYNMQDSEQLPNPRIVSLNTFNDKAIDEIHETMSPFPYDASGEKWNPIIKEMSMYRQYLYYEDGFVYYRESKEGISWKIIREAVLNPFRMGHLEDLIGEIDDFHMDTSMEREALYKDIPSAENPPVNCWVGWDKNGIPPTNPFGRDYYLRDGSGKDTTMYDLRTQTKLSIYYVYNDDDYRLLVMTGYEGVPVILGYNKATKAWLPIINTAPAAVRRMKWGLRPGAISLITRHDAYVDTANKTQMTIFHLLSRDKMGGDFGPGLIASGGTNLADPVIADTLICGNYKGYTTAPAVTGSNVNALLPMRFTSQDSTPRQFTRFSINNRSTDSQDALDKLWNWPLYSIYGVPDALDVNQLHGYNHINTFEIVRGSFAMVLQGFDLILMRPYRYANSSIRDESNESGSCRWIYGLAKKVEDWLIAQMTASGHIPPTTGNLGSIWSMYAYSNDSFSVKQWSYASNDHGKTYQFQAQYLPTSYILFAVSGASTYGVPDGVYRITITIPHSWLNLLMATMSGTGTDAILRTDVSSPVELVNNATIESFIRFPNFSLYKSSIKARYLRSYSKEKTGVHSLVSMVGATNNTSNPSDSVINYQTDYVRNAWSIFNVNDAITPVKMVDEVPTGIGMDLDSYSDPASYLSLMNTTAGAGTKNMPRIPANRTTSYRSRNTDQWHGIPPYQTGKAYKQAWSLNPGYQLYPYNTSYMQTITDPMGYTIFGTNQTVVAKSFLGMYAYLYRFNVAYKNEAITNMQQTEDLIVEARSVLNDGMEVFTN